MIGMENVRYFCGHRWAHDLGIDRQMYPPPLSPNWKQMSERSRKCPELILLRDESRDNNSNGTFQHPVLVMAHGMTQDIKHARTHTISLADF